MRSAWIVVPCFNEAERISASAFADFVTANDSTGFILVDDGSSDATLDVLNGVAELCSGAVRVVAKQPNAGKAEAVRSGVQTALQMPDCRFIGYWDADLATPLEEIPRFMDVFPEFPGVEFVLGSRVKRLGSDIERHPWRHYLGRIFATAASMTLRLGVYDTQCGAKLMTRRVAAAAFSEPFTSPWLFDVEIIARLAQREGKAQVEKMLFELPLRYWRDVDGSKVKATYYLKAPLELWRIARRYR